MGRRLTRVRSLNVAIWKLLSFRFLLIPLSGSAILIFTVLPKNQCFNMKRATLTDP